MACRGIAVTGTKGSLMIGRNMDIRLHKRFALIGADTQALAI